MPRIRTFKPDFWSDSKMVKLSPYARLFFMGMWSFALCDHGHLPDDAEELKLKILPADPVDPDELVAELIKLDRVRRMVTDDGRTFLWVVRLDNHQKVDSRWVTRCPYCTLETPASPVPPTETHRNSREPQRDSSELPPVREGKVREGNALLRSAPEDPAAEHAPTLWVVPPPVATLPARTDLSVTQRSKRITDAYAERAGPLIKWPAVNAIVLRALKAEQWTDTAVLEAILRLADDRRSITVDTLRIELEGPPRPRDQHVQVNGVRVRPEIADQLADRERWAAEDARQSGPHALEGTAS